jgi:hypothetical protein
LTVKIPTTVERKEITEKKILVSNADLLSSNPDEAGKKLWETRKGIKIEITNNKVGVQDKKQ